MITTTARRVPSLLVFLAALFFLSGTSALIYQVLWLRLLGLVSGVTAYAASTVWGVLAWRSAASSAAARPIACAVPHNGDGTSHRSTSAP
jgi:hypothetical protein